MNRMLTIKQVVDELDGTVSRSTIWRQCRSGRIPAVQIGSRWLIPRWWLRRRPFLPPDEGAN